MRGLAVCRRRFVDIFVLVGREKGLRIGETGVAKVSGAWLASVCRDFDLGSTGDEDVRSRCG